MSQVGKTLRLGRIFDQKTNRTVIVAIDHGLFMGPLKGLVEPPKVVKKALKGGANAVVVSPGECQHIATEVKGQAGLILRIDGATTIYGPEFFNTRRIALVEDAVRMGVDAVIAMGYIGTAKENEVLASLGAIARECEKFGVPLVAEMIPVKGERIKDPYSAEVVGLAARVGAEMGADIIKTYYTGREDTFKEVVRGCTVPVVIAGGPKMETEEQVLKMVERAISAGAVGVAFGRNIWQHENPEGMTRAITKIVHEKVTIKKALKEFKKQRHLDVMGS
ncbi:fructose-bisphosphate aldolase [Candidatus Bathyarchaeota archaeon]|nr:fructose-bisphosphate aldolase [Candidatus Bathyarchaeota archaeon]